MTHAALDAALNFHSQDLAVLPLPAGAKDITYTWRFWQNERQTERDIRALFGAAYDLNIAALHGAASRNLFGLDRDDPQSFNDTGNRLTGLGIVTWTVQSNCTSGHVGGGTYLLRAPQPVKSNCVIRGQGEFSIIWGRHPSGSVYTVTNTNAPIFELPTLTALDWLKLEPADTEPEKLKKIPRLAWRLLQGDAATVGKYQSRSEAEAAIVASLIRAGYAFGEIAHLCIIYPGPGKFAEKYAVKPKTALDYLRRTFRNEQEFINTHASDAERQARELQAWAHSRPWPGQTGATDKAVYLAHLAIVERCGQSPHGASARELAEIAGVDWHTAANANHRLVDAGLLTLDVSATPSLSARYSLVLRSDLHTSTHSVNYTVMECVEVYRHHDAFRRSGLGKAGGDVWACLKGQGDDGAKDAQIARMTGRNVRTVKAKLAKMYGLGMVEPLGDRHWRAVAGVDLERIAAELGTFGKGELQRKQHERDRRLHRTVLGAGKRRAALVRPGLPYS
jgi:hypothetical protein